MSNNKKRHFFKRRTGTSSGAEPSVVESAWPTLTVEQKSQKIIWFLRTKRVLLEDISI